MMVASVTLASVACGPDEPAPALPDDDDTGTVVEGRFGMVNLVETAAGTQAHAVFSQRAPSLDLIDGLAWLGAVDPAFGYWVVQDTMDQLLPVAEFEVELAWTEDLYYDVGEAVSLGGIVAPRVDDWTDPDGFHDANLVFYRSDDVAVFPVGDVDLSWPGGVDVEAVAVEAVVEEVDGVELTSHDPAGQQMWYEGTDLHIGWVGGSGGEVWLTLLGDESWLAARISQDDNFTLPSDVLSGAARDGFDIRVARTAAREVAVGPGSVVVRTTREQRLSFQRSGVLTVVPDVVHLDTAAELQIVHHDGTFIEGTTTFDLGEGVVVGSVEVPGGEGDTANLQVTVETTALTGERDVTAVIGGETVVSERMLTVHLPPAETCEEAFALPEPKTYHGDLRGLDDDYSDPSACTGFPAEGPDAVYAIEVADDEILTCTMFYPDGDSILYLAAGCDSVEQPVACSDSGGLNVAEFFSFAPSVGAGGTYYLIADTYGEPSEDATEGYSLYIERYVY